MSGQGLADFEVFIAELERSLGHADREAPFRGDTTGLLLPLERKSVSPPRGVRGPHGRAGSGSARSGSGHGGASILAPILWPRRNGPTRRCWRRYGSILPAIDRCGPIEAWIVDDTGMAKKGRGVARHYCGRLGKQETLRGCGDPAAHRLPGGGQPVGGERGGEPAGRLAALLPEEWAHDGERRRKVGVPAEVEFATKSAIALAQIEAALQASVPKGVVLAAIGYGAGYGADMKLQARLTEVGLDFILGPVTGEDLD